MTSVNSFEDMEYFHSKICGIVQINKIIREYVTDGVIDFAKRIFGFINDCVII